jgi:predicted DNA-binding transcriptional regulator YafY
LRRDFRHFKLERLRSLDVLSERFEMRPDFSLRAHLESQMRAEETVTVRVWFSVDAMERVRRESFTGIVTEKATADGCELELRTFSLEWLANWLLSFGDNAEALAPARLRLLVLERALAVADRYRRPGRPVRAAVPDRAEMVEVS